MISRIARLPDAVCLQFLLFLKTEDQIQFTRCNRYIFTQFMKSFVRRVILNRPRQIQSFLDDNSDQYRNKILQQIDNPYQQLELDLMDDDELRPTFTTSIVIPPLHRLECSFFEFYLLFMDRISKVHTLDLSLLIFEVEDREEEEEGKELEDGYDHPSQVPQLSQITYHPIDYIASAEQYLRAEEEGEAYGYATDELIQAQDLSYRQHIHRMFYDLKENHHFLNLIELKLRYGYRIPNIPYLSNIKSLDIYYFDRIRSIPSDYGRTLNSLVLGECDRLVDVTGLGFIPKLSIFRCSQLADITPLTNNSEVKIYGRNISVFSPSAAKPSSVVPFENSHFIDIVFTTDQDFYDYHLLKKVRSLRIEYEDGLERKLPFELPTSLRQLEVLCCQFTDLTIPFEANYFQHLIHFALVECSTVTSVEWLRNVPFLFFQDVYNLNSLAGLENGRVEGITILKQNMIEDFSPLRFIKKVVLSDCIGFKNGRDVDHVKHLTIRHSLPFGAEWTFCRVPPINDFKMFGEHVEHLELYGCLHLESFEGLENIPILEVDDYLLHHMELKEFKEGKHNKIVISICSKIPLPPALEEIVNAGKYHVIRKEDELILLKRHS